MAGFTKAPELRVIVVGKTGVGKSATGNTILGEENFVSDVSPKSVTQKCEKETGDFQGRKITVVDTPGYFDPDRKNKETSRIIRDSVQVFDPGFHAIILVLKLDRFTPEEKAVADEVQRILKVRARDYTVLLFTRKEDLRGRPLNSYLANANKDLRQVLDYCGNRYLAFNNHAAGEEKEAQVAELIEMIDKMRQMNRNNPLYTPEMFEEDSSSFDCCTLL